VLLSRADDSHLQRGQHGIGHYETEGEAAAVAFLRRPTSVVKASSPHVGDSHRIEISVENSNVRSELRIKGLVNTANGRKLLLRLLTPIANTWSRRDAPYKVSANTS
jgi:hypothetical protein